MRKNRFYMHEKAMDVCVKVVSAIKVSPVRNDFSVIVDWYNLGYEGKPWLVPADRQSITVSGNEWRDITSLMFNPRKQSGLPT